MDACTLFPVPDQRNGLKSGIQASRKLPVPAFPDPNPCTIPREQPLPFLFMWPSAISQVRSLLPTLDRTWSRIYLKPVKGNPGFGAVRIDCGGVLIPNAAYTDFPCMSAQQRRILYPDKDFEIEETERRARTGKTAAGVSTRSKRRTSRKQSSPRGESPLRFDVHMGTRAFCDVRERRDRGKEPAAPYVNQVACATYRMSMQSP